MGSFGNRRGLVAAFFALAAPLACGGTSLRGGDDTGGSEMGGSGGSNSNGVVTVPGTSGAWTHGAYAVGGNGDAGGLPVVGGAGLGGNGGFGGVGFVNPPLEGYLCPSAVPVQLPGCPGLVLGYGVIGVPVCSFSTPQCRHLAAECKGSWQLRCLDDEGLGGAPSVGEAGAAGFAGDGNGGAGGAP